MPAPVIDPKALLDAALERRPRILYVEDDAMVARAMRRVLEREGFEVEHVTTTLAARHALNRHRDESVSLAAILSDWNLAVGTAEAVVGWARSERIPCLVMSGSPGRTGILPWIDKTDLDGLRDWLRSVRAELEQRAGATS